MKRSVHVLCDNRLRMDARALEPVHLEWLTDKLTFKNPAWGRLKAMGVKWSPEPKTYCMVNKSGDGKEVSVPRGCMDTLRELFDHFGFDYQVEDKRSDGDAAITGSYEDPWQLQNGVQFPAHKMVPWDHQRGIVDAVKRFEQALIRSGTGSGKTSAMLMAISELGVPALVIMWDTGLLKQWRERIEIELGISMKDQGLIQGKTFRLRGITLAMQQTMNHWDEQQWERIRSVFGFVGFDEVQRYAARTFTDTADRFDARFRVGVSADERRKDGKHFLIYSMFGKVRHEVSKQELIDKRIVHEVEVYVVPTEFRADWYRDKREQKEDEDGNAQMIGGQDFNQLLDEMQLDLPRNQLAARLIKDCVHSGLPTLSFTHRVDHAKVIDSMVTAHGLKSGLALGGLEWQDSFDQTISGLRSGALDVGCGTFGKLGVGHDIPTVAAGLAVTPVHNNRPFMEQVKGRICRTSSGKENARILVLWDRHVFGAVPLYNLKRWNNTVRVWCSWDKRWKQIDEYLKEMRHDRSDSGTAQDQVDNLFASAHR